MQIHGNVFKLAADELKRLSADKQTRIIIEAREKALRDEATLISEAEENGVKRGLEQGEEKGRNEREIEIAKNALSMGLEIGNIAKLTGLSEKEIEKLKLN